MIYVNLYCTVYSVSCLEMLQILTACTREYRTVYNLQYASY